MQTIVECVPNVSEGRDARKVDEIVRAIVSEPDVYVLDRKMDPDHNRSVITFVGTRESVGEAALRGIGKAAELIDLNNHRGAHPRLGATDVVPFVPVSGVTLEDCVHIAEWVAEATWRRFGIPAYLYEAAARRPERRNLENVRRGQFEGIREQVRTDPDRLPDFGPKFGEGGLHPTAGATVVGARKFLIAYNINLNTQDVSIAKSIARKTRASGGGFPCVKAMGVELKARNVAQVSMNLTDFETTPIGNVFDAVVQEAAANGVSVEGSEIVGLIPRRALEDAAVHYLRVLNYDSDLILENRLAHVLESANSLSSFEPRSLESADLGGSGEVARTVPQAAVIACGDRKPLHELVSGFLDAVAADTPAPGGGAVAALAGALAAALGEMVCRLSLKKSAAASHHETIKETLHRLQDCRRRLLEAVDRDAASFEGVIAALKLPKSAAAEQSIRARAIEGASKAAAQVPLETAELSTYVDRCLESLQAITVPQTASDLVVGRLMASAARRGGMENVRANLPSIHDAEWLSGIEARLKGAGA
jgi:glutamate formiminotransferase